MIIFSESPCFVTGQSRSTNGTFLFSFFLIVHISSFGLISYRVVLFFIINVYILFFFLDIGDFAEVKQEANCARCMSSKPDSCAAFL